MINPHEKTQSEDRERVSSCSQTENMNLRYLVDTETESKRAIPIQLYFYIFFIFSFLAAGLWLIYSKSRAYPIHHTVVEGDTLRSLASRYYQNPDQWYKIFLANRKKLIMKNKLSPGDVLFIPALESVSLPKKNLPKSNR